MSDFNPELWGLRIRSAMGLPCPPPPGAPAEDVVRWAALERARRDIQEISGLSLIEPTTPGQPR